MTGLEWITLKEWFDALEGIHLVLIVAILLLFMGYIYLLIKNTQLEFVGRLVGKWTIRIWGILFGSIAVFYLLYNIDSMLPYNWMDISLLVGLVAVTCVYALYTARQAAASVEMAEEMRSQRIIASRPVIIQKAQQKKVVQATITTDYFSHFEIYNAGNGPAIEPEIFLLDENKSPVFLEDEITYLRTGDAPVKLLPAEFGKVQTLPDIEPPVKVIPIHLALRDKCTYLVTQYQSIFSYGRQPIWYQTWLPFKSHRVNGKDEIRLIPGKLEFHEASEKERIVMPLVKGKPK